MDQSDNGKSRFCASALTEEELLCMSWDRRGSPIASKILRVIKIQMLKEGD
jgi:hypothetical protein